MPWPDDFAMYRYISFYLSSTCHFAMSLGFSSKLSQTLSSHCFPTELGALAGSSFCVCNKLRRFAAGYPPPPGYGQPPPQPGR